MLSIEMATPEELPRVCELFLERGKEFDFGPFPPPVFDDIRLTVYRCYAQAPCFVLKTEQGEIVGFAGLAVRTFCWNESAPFLTDYMAYVQAPYRDYKVAQMLYNAIIEFAALHGLGVHLYYIATERHDARLRLMRRLGFKQTGFLLSYGGK